MFIMKLEGYSSYEIYPNTGKIYSYITNRYIGGKDKDGYIIVNLRGDNGVKKVFRVHKLIWNIVNGEIPEGMEINHIDENKSNNSISNIYPLSHIDNCNWGTRNERILKNRKGKFKKKPVIALQGENIKLYFSSTRDAEIQGYCSGHITNCCWGKAKTHKGYEWQYLDEYLSNWWDAQMYSNN